MISTRLHPWTSRLLVFLGPSVFGGVAFWFFVQQALRGHVVFNDIALVNIGIFLLLGLLCLGLWLGPLLLVPYLAAWRSVRFVCVGVAALPILLFFPLAIWTGLAWLLIVGFGWWGMESIADDMHNRLTVQPIHSLPRGITFVIFALIMSISVLYYQQLRGSDTTTEELSDRLIDQTVAIAERSLPLLYKDYRSGMTIDELIGAQIPTADSILKDVNLGSFTNQAEQQRALEQRLRDLGLEGQEASIDVKQGEAQIRQQLEDRLKEFRGQTIDTARQELAKRLGVAVAGTDSVHTVLTRVVGKQFDTYVRRYVTFVPLLLSLALFFVLRFLTSLFQAVVVWCGWIVFRLYRKFKIFVVDHQNVPAEHLAWPT